MRTEFETELDTTMEQLSEKKTANAKIDKWAKTVIADAAAKLQHPELVNDQSRYPYAVALFKRNYKNYCDFCKKAQRNRSPAEIANIALLNVLCTCTTGAYRPVIQADWGNQLLVPPYDQYENSSHALIDMANNIDFTYYDTKGLEADAIFTELERGGLQIDLLESFLRDGYLPKKPKPTTTPKTTPESLYGTPRLVPPDGVTKE